MPIPTDITRRDFLNIVSDSAKGALAAKTLAEITKLGLTHFVDTNIKFPFEGKDPRTTAEVPNHFDPFCVTDYAGSIYPFFYPNRHYMGHIKFMMKAGEHSLVTGVTRKYVISLNDRKRSLDQDILEQTEIHKKNIVETYGTEYLDPTVLNLFSASLGISTVASAITNFYETSEQFRRIRGIKANYSSSDIDKLISLYENYIKNNMPKTPNKLVSSIGEDNDGWDKPRHLISHMYLSYTYMFGSYFERPFIKTIPPVLQNLDENPEVLAMGLSSLAGASYEITSTFKDSAAGLNDTKYPFDIKANNFGRDAGIEVFKLLQSGESLDTSFSVAFGS